MLNYQPIKQKKTKTKQKPMAMILVTRIGCTHFQERKWDACCTFSRASNAGLQVFPRLTRTCVVLLILIDVHCVTCITIFANLDFRLCFTRHIGELLLGL